VRTSKIPQVTKRSSCFFITIVYCYLILHVDETVTGQLADKPTRGQSSHKLVNSPKCLI